MLMRAGELEFLPVPTINVHIDNLRLVNKKYPIRNRIEREGPNIFQSSDEHSHIAAVEFCTYHRLLTARIGPKEQPQHGMDRNAARFFSVAGVDSAQTLDGIYAGQTKHETKFKFDEC